jgi:hypothetical protein
MPVFIDPRTGERFENVPDDEAERAQSEFGLVTPERWAAKQEGAAGTVKAGFEGALSVANEFTNLVGGGTPEETEQIRRMLSSPEALARKEENPIAHGIGVSAPSIAAGGALGGASIGGAALGLGIESAASGASQEASAAALEGREFDLGNAAEAAATEFAIGAATLGAVKAGNLFLGGAGKGLMNELPKGIKAGPGNVKKAVTAVDAASEDGVVDVMAQAAEGAGKKRAKIATDLPPGPERAEALASTADQHYDSMAVEFASDADKADALMSKLGDTSASPMVEKRLRETIGEQSPAQMRAVTETTEMAAALRKELTKPLDEVVDEAPIRFADDAPPVSGEMPIPEPFRKGEGFNFETGAVEPSAKPPKPGKPRTLATTNKLRGIASEIDTTIRNMTTKLDKSTDSVDWYLAMRKAKQEMQDTVRTLGNMADKGDEVLHGKLQKMSDDFATHLKNELTKQEHWGKAAEIEAGINAAWHDKWLKGRLIAQNDLARKAGREYRTGRELVEYDPAKYRTFMKGDRISRTVTQRHLDRVVDGWEDMAKVHELHGTASPADIKLLRDTAKSARNKLALVDEIQDAVAGRVTKKANPLVEMATDVVTDLIPGGNMVRGLVKKGLKTEVGKQVTSAAYDRAKSLLGRRQTQAGSANVGGLAAASGAGVVGIGALAVAKKNQDLETQAERIVSTDESGKLMTKQTGRTLAGVSSKYNDRAAGEEQPPPPTALSRFTEGYADPESSFEAKRKLLEDEQLSPTVLYEVMAESFGDLPRISPGLFQQVASRTAQGIQYLRNNQPAGIKTSLLYPNGTPPSRSALRDWATMWNTFTDPESVLEDINNGTAVPLQMQTLRDVHPDIYDQLKADVIEQVGTHFRSVPTSTKAQLDLLFQADGLAGPMWSSAAADMIGQAMATEKQGSGKMAADTAGGDTIGAASGPGGVEAIHGSVTNRGN